MRPRFASDYRTLLWVFVLFPGVAFAHYIWPSLVGWLLPVSIYLGYCAGVLSHNHNHCPTFANRKMNDFFGAWLSVFYGYPLFA
jgi:fatty acid desaturase